MGQPLLPFVQHSWFQCRDIGKTDQPSPAVMPIAGVKGHWVTSLILSLIYCLFYFPPTPDSPNQKQIRHPKNVHRQREKPETQCS